MYVCVYVYMDVWIRYDVAEVSSWVIRSEDTRKTKLIFIKNYEYID
jgi:hypothetical protein